MADAGELIDRYVVEAVLGEGGMGRVYRALDPRLGRRVAIKVLLASGGSELERTAAAARMVREARAAAAFNHPNVVAIYDVGEVDGRPYIAMELVTGVSLRAFVKDPNATTPQKLAWLLDVARGLDAAHRSGLVHRDIKPDNVMITPDGVVKILDFGIARRAEVSGAIPTGTPTEAGLLSLTSEGQMLGTPQYMAPEQLQGEPLDGRADQFAWGVMAWELFAGALPWGGSKSGAQVIAAVLAMPVPPLHETTPSVARIVSEAVGRALSKRRADRFATMGDLLATLGAHRASAMPPPSSQDMAFEPTQISAPAPFVSGTLRTSLTSASPLAHTRGATPIRQTPIRWPRVLAITAGGAAVAGIVAFAVSTRGPRVTACSELGVTDLGLFDSADGPRCLRSLPVAAAPRVRRSFRLDEAGGRVQSVERVTFAGTRVTPGDTRSEVVRGSDGSIREIVTRDAKGNVTEWQKWLEGGRRIQFVDDDGSTPRHALKSRITGITRELDARGIVVRETYLGATGRPRLAEGFAYGLSYSAAHDGRWTRLTYLAADGRPGVTERWGAAQDFHYEDAPPTRDARFLDLEGRPMPDYAGVFHERLVGASAGKDDGSIQFFGRDEASVVHRSHGASGERCSFDSAKRTRECSPIDEKGRPHPYRGDSWVTIVLSYDQRGRGVLIEHLDANRNRVAARDRSLGGRFEAMERYVWNDRDDLVELRELDAAGALTTNGDGFARREQLFDAAGRAIEARYYDDAGHLVPRREGGAIWRTTYDDRGLPIIEAYFDSTDHAVASLHGYASVRTKYDRLRNPVEVARFGADGRACVDDDGISVERSTYDENDDLVAVSYFDASGAPTMRHGDYATKRMKNDDRGLVIEEEYLDGHGDRIVRRDGYAIARYVRDRNDDVVEEAYFGRRDEPKARAGGYAKKKTTFDARRHPVETALFGASGAPQIGAEGWAIERSTYDAGALLVRRDHFDAAGNPVLTTSGAASSVMAYDARGNLVEDTALGLDGKPIATREGYATKKSTYDDRDALVVEARFGADGKPAAGPGGWSIRQLRYGDLGELADEAFFDGEHHPVTLKGTAYASVRSRYDARQRLVERAYFDIDGAPAKGPDGAESVRYQRDAYGRATETSFLDGAGIPVASVEGKVVIHTQYDDAGRPVEERVVDGGGAPLVAKDGCAGHRTKYDLAGRTLEETCLDAKGAPAVSGEGWAIRRTLHDARGNAVDVATYGPEGSPRADKQGIARRRSRFDERNLVRETSSFDVSGKSTRVVELTYDEAGHPTGQRSP